jgi:hypothetical protein
MWTLCESKRIWNLWVTLDKFFGTRNYISTILYRNSIHRLSYWLLLIYSLLKLFAPKIVFKFQTLTVERVKPRHPILHFFAAVTHITQTYISKRKIREISVRLYNQGREELYWWTPIKVFKMAINASELGPVSLMSVVKIKYYFHFGYVSNY